MFHVAAIGWLKQRVRFETPPSALNRLLCVVVLTSVRRFVAAVTPSCLYIIGWHKSHREKDFLIYPYPLTSARSRRPLPLLPLLRAKPHHHRSQRRPMGALQGYRCLAAPE